jgi:parallel beta-helix repeat protein
MAPTAAQAEGATLQVGPGGYGSIQSAVAAARSGDTVQVAAGTYVENVTIGDKYIVLRGNPADPARVVIRASFSEGARSPLFVQNVPDSGASRVVVDGFTITGGSSSPDGQGGGITIAPNASPELRNLIVSGNTAQSYGGGISIHDNSHPYIHDSLITGNGARSGGGGIFVVNGSSPVIAKNRITSNYVSGASITNGGSSGGGIYLENVPGSAQLRSAPIVVGNTITGNTADFAGGGVMLRTGVDALLEGNTISGNTAAYGAGIHAETGGSTVTIDGNTIESNVATTDSRYGGSGYGGGIAVYDLTNATIVRNTIQRNTASEGGAGISVSENAAATLTSNTIASNTVNDNGAAGNTEGGGVYVSLNSSIVAVNNVVTSNSADIGGAFGLLDNSTSTITHNTIAKNTSTVAAGGAIFVRNAGGVSVTSASITNNILTQNNGYQIFEQAPKATIANNLIASPGSQPAESGSGLYFSYTTNGLSSASAINSNSAVNATDNVGGDPGFTSLASDDYTVSAASAAIGRATATSAPAATLDRRGVQRVTQPRTIGAFQYEATPVNSQAPTISGTVQVGSTLTATPGTWGTAASTWTYSWLRNGTAISGATGAQYVPVLADNGATLSVTATASKYAAISASFTSARTGAVARGPYFADVSASHSFYREIEWMASSGLSTGTANPPNAPLYAPDNAVSRQAMAAFLFRLSGETFTAPATATFADVDSASPFYTAVEWMSARAISTGTAQPSGKPVFAPAAPVSREVMAIFLARYAKINTSTPPTTQSFADVPLSAASAAAIAWMKNVGISTGTAQPSGLPLYKPADPVSRQAMAAFLSRLAALPD